MMTMVTSSDGLMVVNTDADILPVQMGTCKLILVAKVTSTDGVMVVNTDDKCDQFR